MKPNEVKAVNGSDTPRITLQPSGSLLFQFPDKLKETLDRDLEFDYENLQIEAEPTVMELVEHISKQAGWEGFFHTQCAYTKNQIEVCKEVYNTWYNKTCYQHRLDLMEKYKSKFSEKLLENFMHVNYQLKILTKRAAIIQLETKYRDLCGVRDAIINKGKYLQTLKGLIEIKQSPIKQSPMKQEG